MGTDEKQLSDIGEMDDLFVYDNEDQSEVDDKSVQDNADSGLSSIDDMFGGEEANKAEKEETENVMTELSSLDDTENTEGLGSIFSGYGDTNGTDSENDVADLGEVGEQDIFEKQGYKKAKKQKKVKKSSIFANLLYVVLIIGIIIAMNKIKESKENQSQQIAETRDSLIEQESKEINLNMISPLWLNDETGCIEGTIRNEGDKVSKIAISIDVYDASGKLICNMVKENSNTLEEGDLWELEISVSGTAIDGMVGDELNFKYQITGSSY